MAIMGRKKQMIKRMMGNIKTMKRDLAEKERREMEEARSKKTTLKINTHLLFVLSINGLIVFS